MAKVNNSNLDKNSVYTDYDFKIDPQGNFRTDMTINLDLPKVSKNTKRTKNNSVSKEVPKTEVVSKVDDNLDFSAMLKNIAESSAAASNKIESIQFLRDYVEKTEYINDYEGELLDSKIPSGTQLAKLLTEGFNDDVRAAKYHGVLEELNSDIELRKKIVLEMCARQINKIESGKADLKLMDVYGNPIKV
jgi:hypothetical protein